MAFLRSLNDFPQWRSTIRVVATDMDGTLTRNEEFSAALLTDLMRLDEAGVAVVITTGRSAGWVRSEEHTSELQSLTNLVCRLLLEKKKKIKNKKI